MDKKTLMLYKKMLEKNAENFLEDFSENDDYNNDFDVEIKLSTGIIKLEYSAQLHENLMKLIDDELNECIDENKENFINLVYNNITRQEVENFAIEFIGYNFYEYRDDLTIKDHLSIAYDEKTEIEILNFTEKLQNII